MISVWLFLASLSSLQVVDVHDGDTLVIKTSEGFEITGRLIGIDCPEKPSKARKGRQAGAGQALASEARDRLKSLTSEPFEVKNYGKDVFKRSLIEIVRKADKSLVNLTLVEEGLCQIYKKARAKGFDLAPYREAEARARAKKKGVWGLSTYEPPDVYRKKLSH
jgi:endonuclease YncB( thermonuclease family)